MNTLCANIMFSGSKFHRIMFTSSHANEGKTYVAMNVAPKKWPNWVSGLC